MTLGKNDVYYDLKTLCCVSFLIQDRTDTDGTTVTSISVLYCDKYQDDDDQ